MEQERIVTLTANNGKSVEIQLDFDGERESASIEISGINYHFERIHIDDLLTEYKIDNDPDFNPHTDEDGYCYMIVPFSK